MRLIDADLLEEILDVNIQKLQDEIDDARTYIQKEVYEAQLFSTKEMIRVIKEQPTAFDLDRVMQELEDVKEQNEPRINNKTLERDIKIYKLTMNFAIKIVKAGGIDDN